MIDHDTWLAKVKTELKDRDLASLDYIWDGEHISPFENWSTYPRRLWSDRTGVWTIHAGIVWGTEPHQQLMEVLKLGAGSIGFFIDQSRNWKSILKDIHLDWIQHQWKIDSLDCFESFLDAIPKRQRPIMQGIGWLPHTLQYKALQLYAAVLPQFRFITACITSQDSSRVISTSFSNIIHTMVRWSTNQHITSIAARIAIEYTGGNDLILNISMIRAIRLIWKHILTSFNLDPDQHELYVATHVENIHTSRHDHMIRSSLIAASLVLGGGDSLGIAASDVGAQDLAWGIKAQHIMHYESVLNKAFDPFSGSLVVERLTELIAKKVWDQIAI